MLFATAVILYQSSLLLQQQKLIDETVLASTIASETVLKAHKLIKNLEKNHAGKVFISNRNDFKIEVLRVIKGSKKPTTQGD